MSFAKTLYSLGVGDIVQTRRTLRVKDTFANGVKLEDVATGEAFICADRDHGTLSLCVVLKAAKPEPKVGDKIERRADLRVLPAESVVVNRHGRPLLVLRKRTVDVLGRTETFKESIDNGPYTVIYVP